MYRRWRRAIAFQVARRPSDQDIMRRYRMTVRGTSSCAFQIDVLFQAQHSPCEGMKVGKRTRRSDEQDRMSDMAFADLWKSLEDALAFELGERRALHVTRSQEALRNCAACEFQGFNRHLGS